MEKNQCNRMGKKAKMITSDVKNNEMIVTAKSICTSREYKLPRPERPQKRNTVEKGGYTPHAKQLGFHRDQGRNRWIFGGNRTGKTKCGAQEVVWWARGNHPYRPNRKDTMGWVVSLSTQVQRDVTQAKILELLKKEDIVETVMIKGRKSNRSSGIIDFIKVKNEFDGESIIAFKSCEQGREKFQGTSLDWVWFDEEPPEDIYQECELRVIDRTGCIWGTMTPLKGRTWVHEKVFLKDGDGTSVHQMSWEDNPHLPQEEVARMTKYLSHDELESRKFGRFMDGTGLVFSEFSDENIVESVPEGLEIAVSIDPGHTAPTAILWLGKNKYGDVYVLKDYAEPHKNVVTISRYIREKCEEMGINHNETTILMDSAAKNMVFGMEEDVVTQFRKQGLEIYTNVNKSVQFGIMRLKALFKNADGERKLFVMKSCTNLIREIRSYYWGDSERPVKKNDHCIDALRYFVATELERPIKAHAPKTAHAKFKRKLVRGVR